MSDHQEIATAPGDLPPREVMRRRAEIHHQLRHENTIDPISPRAGEEVAVVALAGSGACLERVRIHYTTDGSVPDPTSASVEMHDHGVEWVDFGGYAARWTGVLPGQNDGTIVRYIISGDTVTGARMLAQDGQGFWYRYAPHESVTVFAYRVGGVRSPEWLADAVIYQIFVDRFRRRDGFAGTSDLQAKHGGDLDGVRVALPYLHDLGVSCIWLSPVGPAPSYHRYDLTDYFAVDPIAGDVESMEALTNAAHARGIRVILDFVPSHFSRHHPAFEAALRDPDAPTHDWFIFYDWPSGYRSFLDMVPSLVSLNTMNEGVRDHLKRSAQFWMECGVDGFRLDHVIGHGMDFWVDFQRDLEAVNPDVVTIGEATDTGDALRRYAGRMNGILDFPLARALRLTFATSEWTLAELDGFLALYDRYMADGPERVSFLDNHDMDRFLHVARQDRASLALAALCMFTLAQTPVLYYGTEVGMTHEISTSDRRHGGDALARQDMPWDESLWDGELRRVMKSLIRFRRSHTRTIRRGRRRLHLDPERRTYAYELGAAGAGSDAYAEGTDDATADLASAGNGRLAVLFNLSDESRSIDVGLPGEPVLSTGPRVVFERSTVELPARTGAIVQLT